jgi:hypothetical protein
MTWTEEIDRTKETRQGEEKSQIELRCEISRWLTMTTGDLIKGEKVVCRSLARNEARKIKKKRKRGIIMVMRSGRGDQKGRREK